MNSKHVFSIYLENIALILITDDTRSYYIYLQKKKKNEKTLHVFQIHYFLILDPINLIKYLKNISWLYTN